MPDRNEIRTLMDDVTWDVRGMIYKAQGKRVVHFLHIRKTGGTAIKYGLKIHPVTKHYAVRMHPHAVRLRDIPVGNLVMFSLRNPIERFTSGFYGRLRQGLPRYFHAWTTQEKSAFESFDSANKLALALSSLDEQERQRAEQAMRNIRSVNSSFWNWFGDEDYFLSRLQDIFFVVFQERLNDDFERLRGKLGLPENAQLPQNEADAHKMPSSVDRSLSAEAKENLKKWYARDYQFIDLCYSKLDIPMIDLQR